MKFVLPRLGLALCAAGLAASTAYAAATTDIDQVRQRFTKSSLSLWVGDAIHYVNHDDVRHNIHLIGEDGSDINYGFQDPNQTIEVRFKKVGTYTARCSIHQGMKMKITVFPGL